MNSPKTILPTAEYSSYLNWYISLCFMASVAGARGAAVSAFTVNKEKPKQPHLKEMMMTRTLGQRQQLRAI